MNYAFNRIYAVNGGDLEEIRAVAAAAQSIEDWIDGFSRLAAKAQAENRRTEAAAYLRAVNFYLTSSDERKQASYEAFVAMMLDLNAEEFSSGRIRAHRVPWMGGYLPVWHSEPEQKTGTRQVAVLHLGYDSLKEELLPVMDCFRRAGIELYLFEGPGQGEALYASGLRLTHEWEKPVKAVLDHFGLDDVTLIGLSLGGYLAPRAAAYEPRISRVIAWGVMYDFFDTVVSRRGKLFEGFLKTCLALRLAPVLDAVTRLKMRKDSYARWGIEQGMHVYGVDSPYAYFRKLADYSMKRISALVTQDFLLLGNSEDHFIPGGHFYRQAEKLVNVRSFTGRIFTRAESAENHVGFGNAPLVAACMANWIKERSAAGTAGAQS